MAARTPTARPGALPLLALLCTLAAPALARAQTPGHFVIGIGGSFGVELNGPKLVLGYAWDRTQVTVGIFGGALVLPPGPGAGLEFSAEWTALPTTPFLLIHEQSVSAVVGAHLGAKLASLSHPTFKVEGIGQYRYDGALTYGFMALGFPQVLEVGAGQRMSLRDDLGPYVEGRLGYPMLLNAELGISSVRER